MYVGTQNCTKQMEPYMFRRNKNGLFCIDLAKTWEKTMVAARIIAAIQDKNKKDVLVSAHKKAKVGDALLPFVSETRP